MNIKITNLHALGQSNIKYKVSIIVIVILASATHYQNAMIHSEILEETEKSKYLAFQICENLHSYITIEITFCG